MSHPHPELTAPGPLPENGLRVIPLGGLGEIGRNMTVFEYDGRLLIVDCGVLFPEEHHPGVDLGGERLDPGRTGHILRHDDKAVAVERPSLLVAERRGHGLLLLLLPSPAPAPRDTDGPHRIPAPMDMSPTASPAAARIRNPVTERDQ